MNDGRLRTCIVGCKRGLGVGKRVRTLDEYQIVGVCDLNREMADAAAAELGASAWTDYAAMLKAEKPDVVFVATNTQPRAMLTIQAADAGVRGIIAEKPMAMSMGEAKAMADAARRNNARLVITHQRRMGSDLLELRALVEQGAIGDLQLIRAHCAGDLLSDGTHSINSVRWLLGDPQALWVLGQIFRVMPDPSRPPTKEFENHTGFRFGHPVESGTMSIIQFASGVRAELFTGRAQPANTAYQTYELFGTRGRLLRPGDKGTLKIWDDQPGGWRELPIRPANQRQEAMCEAWRAFARYLREGGDHPLSVDKALADHELVMAIYESARRNARLDMPLQQDAFPLQLMIDEGRL